MDKQAVKQKVTAHIKRQIIKTTNVKINIVSFM